MDRLKVTVTDQAGGKTVTAELPGEVLISRLLPALVTKMGLPSNVTYGIQHAQSGKQLQGSDTLLDIGVKEGDTLRLLPNVMAGGILPVRTIRDILVTDAILSKIESNPPSLSAIFLYTDWDISLAEFIRNNIDEIDRLAGQECNAFIIEEPTERWVEKNKSSLKKEIGENFDFLWNRLDWASSKPYNKSEAIEIGRRFSIEPEELPVIIIFNSGDSKDYLLVSLNRILASVTDDAEQDYKRFFRKFFSLTSQASKYPAEIRLTMLDKMVKETWKSRQTGKNSLGITEIVKQISLDISLAEMIKLVLAVFGKITP